VTSCPRFVRAPPPQLAPSPPPPNRRTVVSGYVGNKCAVFPMQLLGFDVCPLNSVQFSNHTGYGKGRVAGQVMDDAQLSAIVTMMETNGLLHFSHVLTGEAWGGRCLGRRCRHWRCGLWYPMPAPLAHPPAHPLVPPAPPPLVVQATSARRRSSATLP
jgi:hypothetical protein